MWTTRSATELPAEILREYEKAWDSPLLTTRVQFLKENTAGDPTSKARLLAVATLESSAWLASYPAFTLETELDDHTARNAVALRLRLKVRNSHVCICGQWVAAYGHHAMVCSKSPARLRCHTSMNEAVGRTLQFAGFHTKLEPQGISNIDNKRPDRQTINP